MYTIHFTMNPHAGNHRSTAARLYVRAHIPGPITSERLIGKRVETMWRRDPAGHEPMPGGLHSMRGAVVAAPNYRPPRYLLLGRSPGWRASRVLRSRPSAAVSCRRGRQPRHRLHSQGVAGQPPHLLALRPQEAASGPIYPPPRRQLPDQPAGAPPPRIPALWPRAAALAPPS